MKDTMRAALVKLVVHLLQINMKPDEELGEFVQGDCMLPQKLSKIR